MMISLPLEDNWHDIVSKAMRGLQFNCSSLAQQCHLSEEAVCSLFQKKIFNEKILSALAPVLQLDLRALLQIARDPYQQETFFPKKNFQCFTTFYDNMQVNSYLFWSDENKTAVAFDTGTNLAPLLKMLEQHQLQLNTILLTHSHGDHVGQLKKLITATGATAWIHETELISQAEPFDHSRRWKLDKTITIEARPTPGHSPGGTTYVIHGISPMIAVAGDAIFAGSVGGIPSSSYQAALRVIRENILSLPDKTIIAPGHGPLTTVGNEKAHNPFFA